MNEFLNDPVAIGLAIVALLINLAAVGLKMQAKQRRKEQQREGKNEF